MIKSTLTRSVVLHEDRWLLVVDKTEGVLSHPNSGPGASRRNFAPCAFEGPYDFADRRFDTSAGPVWLIHRLDQDTSGAILAALTGETARRLRLLFDRGAVQKKYLALVEGPVPPKGRWRDHVRKRHEETRVRSAVVKHAPPNAELQLSLKRYYRKSNLSLLEIRLVTGKTHQIRVQAASRGFPLAGDEIYGDFRLNRELRKRIGLRRLFLHASELAFRHPETGKYLKIESPLPPDLRDMLSRLR